MKRLRALLILICFVCLTSTAQSLELKFCEFKENRVLVHYALSDTVLGRLYRVRLYSSKDNFLNPLEKVSGDVGLEVRAGHDNTIVWDPTDEFGKDFNGKVSFEIRGRVFVPFINTESINQYKTFKRKRKYEITWTGGTPQNILNFELFKGENKVFTFPNIANVGSFSLEFPVFIRPGKNYRFRISDSKNKEDITFSNTFRIKRKVPLVLKALPAGATAYAVLLLFQQSSAEEDLPVFDMPFPHE